MQPAAQTRNHSLALAPFLSPHVLVLLTLPSSFHGQSLAYKKCSINDEMNEK